MRVAVGCDHAGRVLCEAAIAQLRDLGHEVMDLTPPAGQKVDYPDFAAAVAGRVSKGEVDRGVLVCGTGIGMAMTANKFHGVRAAVVHDPYTTQMSRQHNDANVLCFGERVIGPGVASECVRLFVETPFEGGRHAARVDKIREFENKR